MTSAFDHTPLKATSTQFSRLQNLQEIGKTIDSIIFCPDVEN
jgi:hypothetical protein